VGPDRARHRLRDRGGVPDRGGESTPTSTPAADRPIKKQDLPPPSYAHKVRAGQEPAAPADDPVDVDPPEAPETGPTSAELQKANELADRIEDEDAPRQLRRIAMQCEQPGRKLEGTMYLTLTLDSGNGQVRVEELQIKDSSLDADVMGCIRPRLENARWPQPDAPDRRWRIGIALALPE
jgi:hypothetical protein